MEEKPVPVAEFAAIKQEFDRRTAELTATWQQQLQAAKNKLAARGARQKPRPLLAAGQRRKRPVKSIFL